MEVSRVAIYARVSTDEQEASNQLRELRRFVGASGWPPAVEYVDIESGGSSSRPWFVELMAAAARREFDLVLFWSLDRFSREGAFETLQRLNTLTACGVAFRSYSEPYLDSCGVFRDAIIAILGTIAKQERIRLSERVKAGLARARQVGTRSGRDIGRPRAVFDRQRAADLRGAGLSLGQVARLMGVGKTTLIRELGESGGGVNRPRS